MIDSNEPPTTGTIRHRASDVIVKYALLMRKSNNRKTRQKQGDDFKKALDSRAKKFALANEVLPEDLASDPHLVRKLFRNRRRRSKWGQREQAKSDEDEEPTAPALVRR